MINIFSDDIPIVEKEDSSVDAKVNLVSITEEEASSDPTRTGSVRQNRDSNKSTSKITNFSLTKKPKDKDNNGKFNKNGYVPNDKDNNNKKSNNQVSNNKDNIKGSKVMLNVDENDSTIPLVTIKKRNDSDTNSIVIDNERHLSNDTNDSVETDDTIRNQDEKTVSTVQVSSV